MDEIKIIQYRRGDTIQARARQAWVILAARVMASDRDRRHPFTMTYGQLAEACGFDAQAGRSMRWPLGLIAEVCLQNNLPALNSVVVNARTREPGDGVLHGGWTVAEEQSKVMEIDWFSYGTPDMAAFDKAKILLDGRNFTAD